MSADNRICLMETQSGWAGWHGSCSMNYFEPYSGRVEYFDSKQEALDWAIKESKDMVILEGGITIVGIEEQALALREVIEDAKIRLDNIEKYGCQFPVNYDLNIR